MKKRQRKVLRPAGRRASRFVSEPLESRRLLNSYLVTTTADSGSSPLSLRQAILDANSHSGLDTISFNISGSGVHTITPATALPEIDDPVIIDGSTQPGYSGTPLIQLTGTSAGSGKDGLDIKAGGSTINALAIGSFGGSGMAIYTGGANLIENSFLGTAPTGTVAAGNGNDGVAISGSSSSNQIVNNLISGNGQTTQFAEVQIFGSGTNSNVLIGNKIGTDVTGTVALGGGGSGVLIQSGASLNRIGTNGDGTNDAAERNIISANGRALAYDGIQIDGTGTNGNIVAGNYIGTDVNGAHALGNGGIGVLISGGAQSNRIGVSDADTDAVAERNIISANGFPNNNPGLQVSGSGTNSNVVAGNYIGTDVSGLLALGNDGLGIRINGGADNNVVGTNGNGIADALERNVIAANTYQGIYLAGAATTGNVIAGNYVGANAAGSALGNLNNGIWIDNGAKNNRIGTNGTDADAAGEGDLITSNGYNGILVTDPSGSGHSTGNSIRGNSIHNNGAGYTGIDNGNDGLNLNHGTALEPGPNNFQNHPVLLAGTAGASTNVSGTLTSVVSTSYALDFYASSSADSPFDGTGDRWLGSATVATNATGTASFSVNVGTASSGEWISATATDPGGNTSEFSTPIQLPAVQIQLNAATWTPIGPAPVMESQGNAPVVSGRVVSAVPDPSNSNVMYIATDGGGVWKSTDWLDPVPQWTPLTDAQQGMQFGNSAYSPLAVAASNTQIVYAAAAWPGGGILKSTNGGATWTELANSTFDFASFASLVVDPTNANTIYLSVWNGPSAGGGVYKSTDGGSTWTNTTASIHNGSAADLVMDPSNPSTLYAGLVGDTTAGGANNGIYKTTNGGTSWTLLSSGVLSGSAVGVSVRLTVSPSSPQDLYANVFDPALGNAPDGEPHRYKTTNGGSSWTALSSLPSGDEFRYWHALLAVDPSNPAIVYTNGDHTLFQSTNSGTTWTQIYAEDPVNVEFDDGGAAIMTGDRGIYRWTGGTTSFQNKHGNLQDMEFYTLTLDPSDPLTAYGIAQDQLAGMKTSGSPVWNYMGGADEVGRVVVDPTNPSTIYEYDPNNGGTAGNIDLGPSAAPAVGTIYFVWKSTDGGATWAAAGTGIPTTNVGFTLAYTSQRAFEMDPSNHNRILVGTNQIYETTNGAGSWTAVSPVLSTGNFISDLAIAPSDGNTVYAGTGNSKFFVTTNDSTWTERDTGLPTSSFAHVMDIAIDPANSQHVFVVCGSPEGGNSNNKHVFVTSNGGVSWTNITGNLPNDATGQAIAVDWRFSTPRLYIGTLSGVFLSPDLGVHWLAFGALPNTTVTDVELSTNFNILAAATYGRGAFEIRVPAGISDVISGTSAADGIALSQDVDQQHVNWTMGYNTGQLLITDPAGLTINGNGASDIVTLNYFGGNPLPNIVHLNGTFFVNGLQGSNPLANQTLEIARSTVYISYSSSDPLSLIQGYLKNGFNNGGWNGTPSASTGVITSTAAHNNALQTTAIGYADSADSVIAGQPANTIELKYTLYGDTTLTGPVGPNDFTRLTQHYHQTIGGTWDTGDFNYDGSVNFNDFTLLTRTYNTSLGSQASPGVQAASGAGDGLAKHHKRRRR